MFLLRHGETALNAAGVLRGQLDVPLSATGRNEAAALGAALGEVSFSAVVSSPLKRALETARPVVEATAAPFRIDKRLRDRSYGKWAGVALGEIVERFGSIDAAPCVEDRDLFEQRVLEAFRAALEPGGTGPAKLPAKVALVTHDAVIRTLLAALLPSFNSASLQLPTGSWSELVARGEAGPFEPVCLGQLPAGGCRP